MKKIFLILTIFMLFVQATIFANTTTVAKIGQTEYDSLDSAISASDSSNTTITLTKDISLDSKLTFPSGSNITLDTNGKTLTIPTVENNYGIVVSGNLTITGNGTINLGLYGIGVSKTGNLTIENGTYKCLTGDYLIGSWGKATIKGGLFDGNYCIANGFENGTVEILDGTFYSKEDTIVLGNTQIFSGSFNQNVDEYLADGIEIKQYNGLYFTGKPYKITIQNSKNGVIETVSEAVAEQPVKLNIKAESGYELDTLKVTDINNKLLAISNGEFVMPNSDVTISATFSLSKLDDTPQTGIKYNSTYIYIMLSVVSVIVIIALRKKTKQI